MTDKIKQPLGSLWEIPTRKDTIEIERPDGSTVTVASSGGTALHVLTIPGDYRAGTKHITATDVDPT